MSKKNFAKKAIPISRPSPEEAMEAVKTLLAFAGDDPTREGLVETPKRVIKAYGEFFAGYDEDPEEVLSKTCLLYTSPSPRDKRQSRMPSSA